MKNILTKISKILLYSIATCVCIVLGLYTYNVVFVEALPIGYLGHQSTSFIEVDRETIAYGEINNISSTTIVFVGGLAAWHGTWWEIMDFLNEKSTEYNYIALDLPPFGYSVTKKETSYFRDAQAKRIQGFIQEKKKVDGEKQKYILIAHSYGAGPTTEFVLQDKNNVVDKLVIIDGVLNIDEKKVRTTTLVSRSDALRTLAVGIGIHSDAFGLSRLKTFTYVHTNLSIELVQLYTQPFSVDGATTHLSSWVKGYIEDPLVYASTKSASYKTIRIPIRLIWGDKDTITPLTDTELLLKIIPDSKLYVLNNIGHIPMIEDREMFVRLLERALRE